MNAALLKDIARLGGHPVRTTYSQATGWLVECGDAFAMASTFVTACVLLYNQINQKQRES